jgi:hypothetical protein
MTKLIALIGLAVAAIGIWALVAAGSFADFIDFPPENDHLIHDIGAFQLGLGATLLLGCVWGDGLLVALGGFFVANTAHMVNHIVDMDLGGRDTDWVIFAVVSAIVGAAFVRRLRQLGYVVRR